MFCLFNFPIKRIGTRPHSQIKKQTETCTFDEGGRNSRFEAMYIQVCNIPFSLIPFSDIEEVKKYRMSVLPFCTSL